jgi:hypothetical protein
MNRPINIAAACKLVTDQISLIAKEANQDGLFGEVHLETDDDWAYDTAIILKIRFPNGGFHDTGYCISPVIEQKAGTLGGKQVDFIQYYIQHEEVTHGVRYYADGSGEPDTSDLVDDFITDNPREAAKKVVLLYVELCINQMFEAQAEAAMAEAQEDYEREMHDWYYCQDN